MIIFSVLLDEKVFRKKFFFPKFLRVIYTIYNMYESVFISVWFDISEAIKNVI